jgi:hypothetical protein
MLTPSIFLILLAGAPPPQNISKPAPEMVRSSQPSPERIQALKTTIEKRKQWSAERRRIGERNRNALYQELRASRRFQNNSTGPGLDVPWGDPFNLQLTPVSRENTTQFGRGDPFSVSPPSAEEGKSFKSCFT